MRTLRTYTSSAEALGDVTVLESQGICTSFKGATQGDAHQVVAGTVELQVSEADAAAAARFLATADKERFDANVPPAKRRKTISRYFKIAAATFVPVVAFFFWKAPELRSSSGGLLVIAFASLGLAVMVGFFSAIMDL